MIALLAFHLLIQGQLGLAEARVPHAQLLQAEATALWNSGGPRFRRQFRKPAEVAVFSARVSQAFGYEVRVISEAMEARDDVTTFRRTSAFSRWARGVTVEIDFNTKGQVERLLVRPASAAAPSAYEQYRVKTPLQLPFEGDWRVLWGGHTYDQNRHSAVSDQRFALDLYMVRRGRSSKGRASKNTDYWCWEQPVLAPANGVIVFTKDGIEDNEPGKFHRGSLFGNHIVISHENGEYSLIAHLRRGSISVRLGDTVRTGMPIAKTGSSGMSSEPHVHYQLMDHPDWKQAHGLPAFFANFIRNGEEVELGEPVRGDVIAPMPSFGLEAPEADSVSP